MTTSKKSIRKIILGALIAGLAVGGSAFSFKQEKMDARLLDTWYFHGSSLADAKDASKYSKTPHPSCGNGAVLPCELIPMDAPSQQELASFLDSETSEDIRDIYSVSTRN